MNKLSYECGVSEKPLKGQTIFENFIQTVDLYGERDALVSPYQNYRATYNDLKKQAIEIGKGLIANNVQKGDRVGIWSANRYEWVIVQYATSSIGAILVNINPAYRPFELKYALKQSEVSCLIMSQNFRKTDYVEIFNSIKEECKMIRSVFIIDTDWQKLKNMGKSVSDLDFYNRFAKLQFDDAINIQYTSGTTGFPKGATLTHHNILNNGFFIGERLNYTEKDIVCLPVPFYHCFGMVLGNMAITSHGACIVIPGDFFEPETVLRIVEQEKCTSLYGVPVMFIAELEHPNFSKYNLSTLRTGIMAGAQCPVKTMREVMDKMNMKDVSICYGMTETSPVSTQTLVTDPLEKRVGTVGKVHPHIQIKIVNPANGMIVPRGTNGELCTRGYSIMLKYWNNSEATANVIDENGWMHTGDLACMDHNGYVTITGRIKDMVLRGGENISPFEIEEFLSSHEAISEVYIIGVPDPKYNEEVMAWVKFKQGMDISCEELTNYCKGKIATYKIPKYWKFVDDFPKTITGKIRKIEMREISIKELGFKGTGNQDIRIE